MMTVRRIPQLGQPSRTAGDRPTREPLLPLAVATIPARGPALDAPGAHARKR